MNTMIIRNAAVTTDDRKLQVLDVIPYRDEPFIVAEWEEPAGGGPRRAKRLLRLLTLQVQKGPQGGIADVMVNTVIPAAVLSGAEKPVAGGPIQVVENPKEIRVEKAGS